MKKTYITPELINIKQPSEVVLYTKSPEYGGEGSGEHEPDAKESSSTNWDDDASDAEW